MASCIPPRRWGALPSISPRARVGYFLGRVLVKAAATQPDGRMGQHLCGFKPDDGGGMWDPGTDGRVVLTVSNGNSIQDDGWDFKINGVVVANYDGGGATSLSYSADLPPGEYTLTAECVAELSDNLFEVTITVDGGAQIETSIDGDGEVGEVRDLGTFTVPSPLP